tara:strand:- start:1600 stop:2184 length:585 start_codon:yes stop_codon:yes gene_type:complete
MKINNIINLSGVLCIIFWLIFILIFKNTLVNNDYKILSGFMIILPILLIIINLFRINNIKKLEIKDTFQNSSKSDTESDTALDTESNKKIENILDSEKNLSSVIPTITFGLASLLKGSKYLNILTPYLLLSILFGTIIPYFIYNLNIKTFNISKNFKLYKLSVSEIIESGFTGFSYSLLITGLILSFLEFNKNT